MNAPLETNHRSWLDKASHDLLNIENNLRSEQVPWDTVCFHAQQAVEKTLKAFLVFHERPLLRSHDLVAILTSCVSADATLVDVESDCRDLTYFAVGARYPEDLFEPTEDDGRRMVAACLRVRKRILESLPR
jgi:HEPN domain-containing protein